MSEPLLIGLAAGFAVASVLSAAVSVFLLVRSRRREASLRAEHERLAERMRVVVDADAEAARVRAATSADFARARNELTVLGEQRDRGQAELRLVDDELARLRAEIQALDGERDLHEIAFYRPRYDFATSGAYRAELERVREAQKALIKAKRAAVGHVEWYVNNSKTEGRKQINQTLKLMLRAFNGECDAAVACVRYNNVHAGVATSAAPRAIDRIRIGRSLPTLNATIS